MSNLSISPNTGVYISGGTNSQSTGTVNFSNSNGVSFGLNTNGVMTATVVTNYLTTAMASNASTQFVQANAVFNGTNASGTIASNALSVSVAAQSVESQSIGMSNIGNTSGTTGIASGGQVRYLFAGGNNITLSQSLNGASGTVTILAGNYITTARASTDAIGLNTAQSNVTWTVNSSGLSLDARGYAGTGLSLTNATATLNSNGLQLSVGAGGGGGGATFSNFAPYDFANVSHFNMANISRPYFFPMRVNQNVTGTVLNNFISISVSSSSNSSHAGDIRMSMGIFSRNVSSLSMVTSGSTSWGWTNTSNNSMTSITGNRIGAVPMNINLTPGEYYLGFIYSTGSTNTNWYTASYMIVSNRGLPHFVPIGSSSNSTYNAIPGWGRAADSSAFNNSYALSAISFDSPTCLIPYVVIQNFTV